MWGVQDWLEDNEATIQRKNQADLQQLDSISQVQEGSKGSARLLFV